MGVDPPVSLCSRSHRPSTPLHLTATPGFKTVPSSATFSSGQTTRSFAVTATDDTDTDGGESVRIAFGNLPSGVGPGPLTSTNVELVDNEPDVEIRIADATAEEGENLRFQLTLSGTSSHAITVQYFITDNTATEQQDYRVPRSQSVTIPQGQTSGIITIETREDIYVEGTETITVNLTGAGNAVIQRGSATGTITDEDAGKQPLVDSIPDNRRTQATIEPGDSWETRTAKVGAIEHYYDQDWFKTTLPGGTCYQLEVRGYDDQKFYDNIGEGHSAWPYRPKGERLLLTDPFIQGVYDRQGNYFEDTQSHWGGHIAKVNVRLANTATVFISVSHNWFDIGGHYDLSIIDLGTVTRHCVDIAN